MYAGIVCTNVTFWYKTQEILGLTAATSGQISFSWGFLRINMPDRSERKLFLKKATSLAKIYAFSFFHPGDCISRRALDGEGPQKVIFDQRLPPQRCIVCCKKSKQANLDLSSHEIVRDERWAL